MIKISSTCTKRNTIQQWKLCIEEWGIRNKVIKPQLVWDDLELFILSLRCLLEKSNNDLITIRIWLSNYLKNYVLCKYYQLWRLELFLIIKLNPKIKLFWWSNSIQNQIVPVNQSFIYGDHFPLHVSLSHPK